VNVALKEWALVCDLLVSGEQVALLRKGGIHEPHRGAFALEHESFLLYPNAEHQTAALVQPHYHARIEETHQPVPRDDGEVIVPGFCHVSDAVALTDPAHVRALAPQACWTESFFEQRLAYKPERPTFLVVVRAYRFPTALRLPYRKAYAGCRSWVPLQDTVPAHLIASAVPALDDHSFAAAREAALDAVGSAIPA
jgi:hypothetical protein